MSADLVDQYISEAVGKTESEGTDAHGLLTAGGGHAETDMERTRLSPRAEIESSVEQSEPQPDTSHIVARVEPAVDQEGTRREDNREIIKSSGKSDGAPSDPHSPWTTGVQ